VTIVFAVMLAEPDEPPVNPPQRGSGRLWGAGAAMASLLVFVMLVRLGGGVSWAPPAQRVTDGSVAALGTALLGAYSLAFEMISLVLLAAILGALVIARPGRGNL
jgi:NADH-quinone oxidoreductase subunit J